MSEEVKISNIHLKIGSHDLSLTVEEARKLKKLLNNLFGHREVRYLQPFHYNPYITIPYWRRWNEWEITYGSANNSDSLGESVNATFSFSENV